MHPHSELGTQRYQAMDMNEILSIIEPLLACRNARSGSFVCYGAVRKIKKVIM